MNNNNFIIIKKPSVGRFFMSKSLNRLCYHLVWSTKNRMPCINPNMDQTIKELARQKARELRIKILACGNTEDHLHILVKIPPDVNIVSGIAAIKGFISHQIKTIYPECDLYWQRGYGAFSISAKHIDRVRNYIERQRKSR